MARIVNNCFPICGPLAAVPLVTPPCPPCAGGDGPGPGEGFNTDFSYESPTLTVVVTDDAGNPVAGLPLNLYVGVSGGAAYVIPTVTDENGQAVANVPQAETGPSLVEVQANPDEGGPFIGSYVVPQEGVDPEPDPVPEVLNELAQTDDGWMLHGSQNRSDGFVKYVAPDAIEMAVSIRYPYPEVAAADSVPEQTGAYVINEDLPDWRFAISLTALGPNTLADFDSITMELSSNTDTGGAPLLVWEYDATSNEWESALGDIVDSTTDGTTVQNIQSFGFDFIREHLTPPVAAAPVTGQFTITLRAVLGPQTHELTSPFAVTAE